MSSGFCQALGCDSARNKDPNISFFRFPKDNRCQIWVERARNPKLFGLTSEEIRVTARLCSRHFPQNAFTNETRKKLLRNALPVAINIGEQHVLEPAFEATEEHQHVDAEQEIFFFGDPDNEMVVEDVVGSPSNSPPEHEVTPKSKRQRTTLEADQSTPGSSKSTPRQTESSEFKTPPQRGGPKTQQKVRQALLTEIGATRMIQLTPRKVKLVTILQKTRKQLQALRRRYTELQEGKRTLKATLQGDFIRQIETNISPAAARLFARQLACGKKSPKGRRFTTDDKIFALSLYKRGPKAYKLFQTMFAVPTPRTLISLLNRLPFPPGINESIFAHLREKVSNMDPSDRACALLFDEVSLSTGLHYSEKLDQIIGFEDYGDLGRENVVANHALVFMARGLHKKWKQPVAYYYCKDVTKTNRLKSLIVKVIESLQNVGLHVICTICDQGSTNRAALQNLVASHPSNIDIGDHGLIFKINDDDIAVIYDPPHLLKSTRNAFLKYNVVWHPEGELQDGSTPSVSTPPQRAEASWDHVKLFASKDKGTIFQHAKKLTQAHLEPTSQQKMRVNLAAEVLSETVAKGIHSMVPDPTLFHLGEPPSSHLHYMPESARWTAKFILDVDRLFDTFNGTQLRAVNCKDHRVAWTPTSIHQTFWPEIFKIIDSWEFTDKETGRIQRSPFQDGWLTTIRGATYVGIILGEKFDVLLLHLNVLNQDALENLFCLVRQHGVDNSNPTCVQFASALKTCIINNLTKVHTKGSNCKPDSDTLLSDLKSFLFPDVAEPVSEDEDAPVGQETEAQLFGPEDTSDELVNENSEFNLDDDLTDEFAAILQEMREDASLELPAGERQTVAIVCGFIVRKVADLSCEQCKSHLTATRAAHDHTSDHTEGQERSDHPELQCSEELITAMGLAAIITEKQLRKAPQIFNLKKNILYQINARVDFAWLTCTEHANTLVPQIINLLCRFTINHFCQKRTRMMKIGSHIVSSCAKPTSRQKRLKKVLHK